MTPLNLPGFEFTFKTKEDKRYIFDEIRRKYLLLTQEEWVRQNFVKYLIHYKNYPSSLIVLEMPFVMNTREQRSDIVVYDKTGKIVLLVECKAPDIALTQKVFDQAAGYNLKLNANMLVITNGISHYCCKPDYENRKWLFLPDIPDFKQIEPLCVN